jgi:hypothetical protein
MKDIILGFIRHFLTATGGALATKGIISAEDVSTVEVASGGLVALVGLVWSVLAKRKDKPATV